MDLTSFLGRNLATKRLVNYLRPMSKDFVRLEFEGSYYCSFPTYGLSLLVEDKGHTVETIFLYSGRFQEFSRYEGTLPCGLDFSMSRSQVRALLGTPSQSGGNKYSKHLKRIVEEWDQYDTKKYYVNITYLKDGAIALICLFLRDK